MPVPTDTFWNIKRLNKVFAVSALVLLGTFGWAVLQDFDKQWRKPQQSGKVWEAALVSEKLEDFAANEQLVKDLDEKIAKKREELQSKDSNYNDLIAHQNKITADLANLDFRTNTLKAVVAEQEKFLEEARTANDQEKVRRLNEKLAEPVKRLNGYVEEQGKLKADLAEAKQKVAAATSELDRLKKDRTALTDARDALAKKRKSLQPDTAIGKLMTHVRQTPLMQFINPAEQVKQQVIPDVLVDLGGVKTVQLIDRCTTCHVNIDKRDFSEEKILGYLEEQLATSRKLVLPEVYSGKTSDPQATRLKPGAAAMPEFWVKMAVAVSPEILKKAGIRNRTNSLAGTIGPSKDPAKPKPTQLNVTVDGKALEAFAFNADADPTVMDTQLSVLATVIEAWLRYNPAAKEQTSSLTRGRVTVAIDPKVIDANAVTQRRTATLLVEDYRNSLMAAIEAKQSKLMLDRYRRALVGEVNIARKNESLPELDPSPVILAHPRLDLYADVDSKHPIEKVGCTSCHDGSGLETRFVLAAHTARPIWVDEKTGASVLPQQLRPGEPIGHEAFTMNDMLRLVYPEDALVPSPVRMLHLATGEAHAAEPTTKPAASVVTAPAEPPAELHEPVEYVDPVTGAKGKAVSQRAHWKTKYEHESGQSVETTEHMWDFPMRPPQYLQANCVRCHTSVTDIQDVAPVVHKGRHLFSNLGCVNCHQMDSIPASEQRKVGTDLRHVGSKLSPAMINTWIWAPKAFRPTTKMPHFFMLENNSSDEEIRRTRQEALAMTEYLVQTSDPFTIKHQLPQGVTGKAEEGRKIFNSIGCLACHQNLSDPVGGQRNGQNITRAEMWITQDMEGSGRLAEEMTRRNGKAPSTSEVKAEALKIFDGMSYNERQLYVDRYLGPPSDPNAFDTYPLLKRPDGTPMPKPVFMQHGPELSGVGQKLTAGGRTTEQARAWLYDWLKEPQHYSSYTVMPSLRLSDQQAADLAEYLLAQSRKNISPDDKWEAGLVETDTEKLRELTGLFLRSRYSPNVAYARADNDAELRNLAIDALKNEKIDQAAAEQRVNAMDKDTMRKVFLGKKLISHYGCMQCHAINGSEQMSSPCANLSDWGQKLVSKLDFGYVDPHKAHGLPNQKIEMVNGLAAEAATLTQPKNPEDWRKSIAEPVTAAWPHVHHTREDWLTQKLHNTRIWDRGKALLEPTREMKDGKVVVDPNSGPKVKDPGKPYDKIKMPTFYLNEEEVTAIVNFVLSNRARLITDKMMADANSAEMKRIAHGRHLVQDKFNCVSCHQIEANKPQIHQYWAEETKIPQFAPPQLRSEGSRVNHAWLFGFVKDVQPIRPTVGPRLPEGIRMPSFHATDEEWTSIIAYFNDIANKESRELMKLIAPILTYRKQHQPAAIASTDSASAAAGMGNGNDWFLAAALQSNVAALREWGLRYKQVGESEVPLAGPFEDMSKGYEKLLYRARLTAEAFKAPYPFVESPQVAMDEQRFKRGEQFFHELDCLKCHTMGPAAQGVSPTAPNLQTVHTRIRRGWAERWVRHPDVIHKNSPMLQFFSGEKIGDPRGQTWARAQEFAPEVIARTEAAYGNTPEEQIKLILDYVWTAGARNHATVNPPAGSKPPSQQMQESGEIKVVVPPPATKPAATAPAPSAPAAVTPAPGPAPAAEKPAPPPAPAAAVPTGTVSGVVTFNGTPPERAEINMAAVKECHDQHPDPPADESFIVNANKQMKNVIVSVKEIEGTFPVPAQTAVIDQKGCQYYPHVLAVMVGQKVSIKNSDAFMHNVHSFSTSNTPMTFAQPNIDPGKAVDPFKRPEKFAVKCDVHPWMLMHVSVFEHPFFAVTGDDGSYKLPPLPAGTHTLVFWHEKLGTQEKEITVQADKKVDVNIAFQP